MKAGLELGWAGNLDKRSQPVTGVCQGLEAGVNLALEGGEAGT